jgi:hypothetical protein
LKTSLIIKINFLILALFVVIFFMISLNKNGLPQGLRDFFASGAETTAKTGNTRLQWCDTRVAALISPDKFKLEQVGMKWFVEKDDRREVHSLQVEKWFGRYCSVNGELLPRTAEPDFNAFAPILFVKFVTSQVEALRRHSDGTFMWKGRAFKSEELDKALNELTEFAQP